MYFSIFYPRVNLTTQHPFTFSCGGFVQHFPRCTEVGADLCSNPSHTAQALSAFCQRQHIKRKCTFQYIPHGFLLSPLLPYSAFVTTYRTAEILSGCGFVWVWLFWVCLLGLFFGLFWLLFGFGFALLFFFFACCTSQLIKWTELPVGL